MPFELLVGPPAAGKTSRALERARAVLNDDGRVWWVGLSHQRTWTYRRAVQDGAVLGLEFLTIQQVAYRLLADAGRLRPLVVGTERLVLIGEAMAELAGALPAPGEARLYAFGIAEAKRFRLRPQDVPIVDATSERLRDVFARYEAVKGERWDYDDFRLQAEALAREGAARVDAALIVVDGWREVGPVDLSLLRSLGETTEVLLCLPEAPPGTEPDERLDGDRIDVACFRAPNPVAEARWLLRSLKRDLAGGFVAQDLAVIAPARDIPALLALADEYGVPLADETPSALADTPFGRRLVDLLTLASTPTAVKLLAIPELEPLGRAALAAGVAGVDAVGELADRLGHGSTGNAWRERLRPAGMPWARELVELATAVGEATRSGAMVAREAFVEAALRRAKEAAVLGSGEPFAAWWEALLREPDVPPRPSSGIAVLDAVRASGRRWPKAYVVGAVAGAYDPGLAEDFFVPEEARVAWPEVFGSPNRRELPHRLRGASDASFRELWSRGDETVITFPEADRDGPLEPEPRLPAAAAPLPTVLAGSRLEHVRGTGYRAPRSHGRLAVPSIERLQRYAECGFRTWAEDLVRGSVRAGAAGAPVTEEVPTTAGDLGTDQRAGGTDLRDAFPTADPPGWRKLLAALIAGAGHASAVQAALDAPDPEVRAWLGRHADRLTRLTYGVRVAAPDGAPWAELHAAHRQDGHATIVRFVAPGELSTPAQAEAELAGRWNEMWAAGRLLKGYGGRIERVDIVVWPLLGNPVDAFEGGITYPWRRVVRALDAVDEAYERFRAGDITPNPGFICRACTVADICREGLR